MQSLKLDQQLKSLVKSERKITHEILLLIQTFDLTRSYRELGYSSLFDYLVKGIGYSEGSAQRRISAARLMKQVPKIQEDLETGVLNLTQMSLVQTAIRQEEKAQNKPLSFIRKTEIIEKLKSQGTFATKKILLQELPHFELPQSQPSPARNAKVNVTLTFTETGWEAVQKLLASMSHKVPSQKLEDLLLYWQNQLQKKQARLQPDFSAPPQRQWKRPQMKLQRKYFSVRLKRQLMQRSLGRCEYTSPVTGKHCGSKHFLEIDHRIPLARGGSHETDNLRILCKAHNDLSAKAWGLGLVT